MKPYNKHILQMVYTLCLFSISCSHVSASTGGAMSQTSHSAYICHDNACTNHSSINFLPSGGADPVTITGAVITGYAWGNDLGWINFAPSGSGVTYDSVTGNLSGYAWSSTSGWVNFRPDNAGTVSLGIPVGVNIQSDGSWYGWAFATGKSGGWIKFDCSVSETCVKVIWNTTTVTSSGGGGSYFVSTPTPKMEVATTSQNSASTTSNQGLKVVPTVAKNIKKVTTKANILSVSGSSSHADTGTPTGKNTNSGNQVISQKTAPNVTATTSSEIKSTQLVVATSSVVKSENGNVVKNTEQTGTAKTSNHPIKNMAQENHTSFISRIVTSIRSFFSWFFR